MKRMLSTAVLLFGLAMSLRACKYRSDYGDTVNVPAASDGCSDGAVRPCGTALGECEPGTQTCENGEWSACSGVGPEIEICDGLDNDCDGDIDEGYDVGAPCVLAGGCIGRRVCRPLREHSGAGGGGGAGTGSSELGGEGGATGAADRGATTCVPDEAAISPEVCDGIDNDCDRNIDPGCACDEGATRECGKAVGACELGVQRCVGGQWERCTGGREPEPEQCDGIDNDCDGVEDDGFDKDVPCDSAGRCPQTRVCSDDGRSSVCQEDETLFAEESCDGIDNDCDGLVDRVLEGGTLRSVCRCESRVLAIVKASDESIKGPDAANLCATTKCASDRPRRLRIDATCYPVCEVPLNPGIEFGYENGQSCINEASPRGLGARACPGDIPPTGIAMTYCLDCRGTTNLPYAMCQSLPRYDLTLFGEGRVWLRVDFTFAAGGPAEVPLNLWFHAGDDRRKHLPLIEVGESPGRYEKFLRVEDACFTPSTQFGDQCSGHGARCSHCGDEEVCGAIVECGEYDLSQAWLQVAAEFCRPMIGLLQTGTITLHTVELVEPNCDE